MILLGKYSAISTSDQLQSIRKNLDQRRQELMEEEPLVDVKENLK